MRKIFLFLFLISICNLYFPSKAIDFPKHYKFPKNYFKGKHYESVKDLFMKHIENVLKIPKKILEVKQAQSGSY